MTTHRLSPLRRTLALGTGLGMLVLTGCAPIVALEAAEHATSVDCAEVSVRLPKTIDEELTRRETNAQATAAWGEPAAVLLRCGVPVPVASDDVCIQLDSLAVDWLMDESKAPRYRFTSYGTDPAVEVIVDNEVVSGQAVLNSLNLAISQLPKNGRACVSLEDAEIIG